MGYKVLLDIRQRIKQSIEKASREPDSVELLAVAKYSTLEQVNVVINEGVTSIAENRVQSSSRWENHPKREELKLHMIGNLQGNKVKPALKIFDSIDTIDSIKLADRIENLSEKRIEVMIEVNISGEENKHGCILDDFQELSIHILSLNHLHLSGVFTMCPIDATGKMRKNIYNRASQLAYDLEQKVGRKFERSYGMSDDFELAIECFATQIRLGRALFGGM